MTRLEPQRGDIPMPVPQAGTRPFWDGCGRHQLMFLGCCSCGQALHAPALVCTNCRSRQLKWSQSNGLGTVYSWTMVWRPQTPAFVVPYSPILVELDEGWSLLSNLVGCDHLDVEIGMRVEVEFHEISSGALLPYFRPHAGPSR
jgi:uncharacterized protein